MAWHQRIQQALLPREDDPFVRLLKERVAAGSQIVRAMYVHADPAEYVVTLERNQELSRLRVPHSESFTRWSLAQAIPMVDANNEGARFGRLLAERLVELTAEVGQGYFESVLITALRDWEPPRTWARLDRQVRVSAPTPGAACTRARATIDRVLSGTAADLGALGYSAREVAEILDSALWVFTGELFHLGPAGGLTPT
jgi:hypothetical protein